MKVRDVMSTEVVTLHAESPMVDAEEIMGFRRMRHLPVVEGRKLVGLITHRDLLRHYLAPLEGQTWVEHQVHKNRVKVREVMTGKVHTVSPDTPLETAARELDENKLGCLLVVDDKGDLVGILTEADFLRLTRVLLKHLVAEGDPSAAKVSAFLASRTGDNQEWPRDEAVLESLRTQPYYTSLPRARLRMVLEAVEADLRGALVGPFTAFTMLGIVM